MKKIDYIEYKAQLEYTTYEFNVWHWENIVREVLIEGLTQELTNAHKLYSPIKDHLCVSPLCHPHKSQLIYGSVHRRMVRRMDRLSKF